MEWFSSDFHLNHKSICGPTLSKWTSGYRNFSSLAEMNDTIIGNLNDVIRENDILYFLGDFAFGDKNEIPKLRERIKCKDIRLIYGNHDHAIKEKYKHLFTWCKDYHEFFSYKTPFILSHYAFGVWNGLGHGAIQLFGHSHNRYTCVRGKQMDVGVDTNNMKPYSIEEILDLMKDVEIVYVDHHNAESPMR